MSTALCGIDTGSLSACLFIYDRFEEKELFIISKFRSRVTIKRVDELHPVYQSSKGRANLLRLLSESELLYN